MYKNTKDMKTEKYAYYNKVRTKKDWKACESETS